MYAIAITLNDTIVGWIDGENHSSRPTFTGRYQKITDAIWKMNFVRNQAPFMNVDTKYDMRIVELMPSI